MAHVVIAGAVAGAAGMATVLVMPRGPVTAAQALTVMGGALLVGLVAGASMRSRAAALLAFAVYGIVLELGRLGAIGPTVGELRIDSPFGIVALVLGRGFHALIAFVPMLIGADLGIRLARRRDGDDAAPRGRARRIVGWMPGGFAGLLMVGLAIALVLPAGTPPIVGADGRPLPGSIAELTDVRLGGDDQAIMLRGRSEDLPVLLYLSGGPGQTDLGWNRAIYADLTDDFIVVGWDQPGTGKSYPAFDGGLTVDRVVSDTIELSEYLRERFDEERIYLLGESWGTILGVLAVQQRPDLYHAWIGSGQMVDPLETTRLLHEDLVALGQRTGDRALLDAMERYGQPPYRDIFAGAFVMGYYPALYAPYTLPPRYLELAVSSGLDQWNVTASEYDLMDKIALFRGLLDYYSVIWPQIQTIDLRRDAPRLEVPVYVLDGVAELDARRDLALEWFEVLTAPAKHLVRFEDAAHSVSFEGIEQFHALLVEEILPATYPGTSR